jgi:hypothetical protein
MDDLEYWRLCGELSVMQAALLAVGVDPASEAGAYCEDWKPHERPRGYEALKTAIVSALRKGEIKGVLVPLYEYDINGNICDEVPGSLDIRDSLVEVASVREWLIGHGFGERVGFLFEPCAISAPPSLLKRLEEVEAKAAGLQQALNEEREAAEASLRQTGRLLTELTAQDARLGEERAAREAAERRAEKAEAEAAELRMALEDLDEKPVDPRERITFERLVYVLARGAGYKLGKPSADEAVIQQYASSIGAMVPTGKGPIASKLKAAVARFEQDRKDRDA